MAKDRTKDLTQGTPWKVIAGFSLPVIGGNLFQLFYTLADSMIVGRTLGADALAAVGATATIVYFVLCFIQGLTGGCGILLGQAFGAGNEKQVRESVSASVWISALFTIVLTVLCCSMVHPILRMLNTPVDIYDRTYTYLFIIFLGNGATVFYNMISNILRALGDSRTPLYFLIFSSLLNVVLDVVFIVPFGMDVAGAAWATVLAQAISAALCIVFALKRFTILHLSAREWRFSAEAAWRHLKVGFPMGFQMSVMCIGQLAMQAAVNRIGTSAIAGYTAANNVLGFLYVSVNAVTQACMSFTSQNYSVGKQKRMDRVLLDCMILSAGVSAVLGVGAYVFGSQVLGIYTSDAEVIKCGMEILSITTVPYFLCGIMDLIPGALRGMGHSAVPMVLSVIGTVGTRIVWIYGFFPHHRSLFFLFISYPGSWIATILMQAVCFYFVRKKCIRQLKTVNG